MKRMLTLLVVVVLASIGSPTAKADGAQQVGDCLTAGQVWLLVVDEAQNVLANQCVGNPNSGEQALADGGVQIRFGQGKGRFICALGGHPEQCPANFDGAYWSYWQGEPGLAYVYSETGAGSSKPQPGSIEAWCYATVETKKCTPPQLAITQHGEAVPPASGEQALDLQVTSNAPVSLPQETPWALIAVGGAVVVLLFGLLIWRRKKAASKTTLGGR